MRVYGPSTQRSHQRLSVASSCPTRRSNPAGLPASAQEPATLSNALFHGGPSTHPSLLPGTLSPALLMMDFVHLYVMALRTPSVTSLSR